MLGILLPALLQKLVGKTFRGKFRSIFREKIGNFPVTPTPSTFSKVLPYTWEAYCSTNGRCTVGFPVRQGLEPKEAQRYKWGAYCHTNWRCTAVLSPRPVGVGVSETLLIKMRASKKIFRANFVTGPNFIHAHPPPLEIENTPLGVGFFSGGGLF